MQKFFILISFLCFIGCGNHRNGDSLYTKEQIASLHIDSTKILHVEKDALIKVDLNSFLEERHFDFGSLVQEIKLIPLETTSESLLDDIRRILVTDTNIYIYDDFKGGGLVIFDREGKFIKRIINGRGPGELVRLYDIDFDEKNNELVAYRHSFLMFFTPSGQYIRQQRLPLGFDEFAVIPDGYVFKATGRQGNTHLGPLIDFTLFVTDKNFKLKSAGLHFPPLVNYVGKQYVSKNNSPISITHRYTDTIYHYISETDQLEARYVLDYSKKKLPEHYTRGAWESFADAVSQNDYYYYLGEYFETECHNVFFLDNSYTTFKTTIYRDKKTGNLIGGTHVNFIMNEIPSIEPPMAASGDYFISLHFPNKKNDALLSNSTMLSDEDKQKIKNVDEEDNPVLVFYKLKDF